MIGFYFKAYTCKRSLINFIFENESRIFEVSLFVYKPTCENSSEAWYLFNMTCYLHSGLTISKELSCNTLINYITSTPIIFHHVRQHVQTDNPDEKWQVIISICKTVTRIRNWEKGHGIDVVALIL